MGLQTVQHRMATHRELVPAQLAADLGLRGADAVYVALAQQLEVPLIT